MFFFWTRPPHRQDEPQLVLLRVLPWRSDSGPPFASPAPSTHSNTSTLKYINLHSNTFTLKYIHAQIHSHLHQNKIHSKIHSLINPYPNSMITSPRSDVTSSPMVALTLNSFHCTMCCLYSTIAPCPK